MKENKNIERLFQEKFKDFEVSPPEFVWENIQEKLNPKEKKRRVIPFWFKTAGIAASFVAIVAVVFFNTNDSFNSNNKINTNNSIVNSETNNGTKNSNQNIEKNLINTEKSNQNNSNSIRKSNSSIGNEVVSNSKSNSVGTTNSSNRISNSKTNYKSNKNSLQNSNSYKSNTGLVSNDKKQTKTSSYKKNQFLNSSSNSGIVVNGSNKNKTTKYKSTSSFNDFNTIHNNSLNTGITDLKTNTDFNSSKNKNSNAVITDTNQFNASKITSNNNGVVLENGAENSKNNNTIINNNTTAIVAVEELKNDTLLLATVIIEENPMEKLLREKETKKVVDEKEKWSKWAVNSYVSPIFFNSFASGSPISEEFATNEKTFNNSTSYGVGVAYNLNKRLSIKTGISNLKLDYDTENIAFYSTFEDQSRIANTNIERNSNGKYLVLINEKDISRNILENQSIQTNENLGNLNQRTQYIEIPVEMSYAILNKKFGIAIKGGMSTLFLTENKISISANDGNIQIGKASNLNNLHFSSNVGLGFSYNIMKDFQLNLEPTLKYQINTFNKNAENFTPYVIGVNTGISYKF